MTAKTLFKTYLLDLRACGCMFLVFIVATHFLLEHPTPINNQLESALNNNQLEISVSNNQLESAEHVAHDTKAIKQAPPSIQH